MPRTESDEDCLQMAVKAFNDTIGPEGLCPSLLVYGAISRPARRTPAATQLARARAIDKAITEVQKEHARRRIAFGLRTYGSPSGNESSNELRRLPAGSPLYAYRTHSRKWEGPFPWVQIDGETVVV